MSDTSKHKEPRSSKNTFFYWAGSIAIFVIFAVLIFFIIWGRVRPTPNTPSETPSNQYSILVLLAITGFLYLIFLMILRSLQNNEYSPRLSPKSELESNSLLVFVSLLSGMIVIGALIGLAGGQFGLSNAPEIQAGVVIVLAVSVLTLLLFILTLGFRSLGLTNLDQPLALPTGSVRAFIALMLIMIFVILSVYVVRSVGEGVYTYVGVLYPSQVNNIIQPEGEDYNFVIRPWPCYPRDESIGCYRVWLVRKLSEDGIKLAQQLTTTVATLVVAVSGFYFGAQSIEQATKTVSASTDGRGSNAPLIRGIDPNQGETSTSVSVILKGRNLFGTKYVRLVKDQDTIEANNVLSGDTTIQCSFKLDKPAGTVWNVVVRNAQGQEDELEDAFTITEKGTRPTEISSEIQSPPDEPVS